MKIEFATTVNIFGEQRVKLQANPLGGKEYKVKGEGRSCRWGGLQSSWASLLGPTAELNHPSDMAWSHGVRDLKIYVQWLPSFPLG